MQKRHAVQEDNSIIKGHVLLVDDEQETCNYLEDGLRRHGFDVSSSDNREKALATLDAQDFDAVIADIQLGPDNGLDLCG
ncbi:MAG TPA: response regulator, partial [Polyangiaceae bacterium]|nr:response regulator [Polyangiaceae bacterium]